MDTSPFRFIWLGQIVGRYEVPLDIFNTLNGIYETNFANLPDAHRQLVGKIEKENSLFYNGPSNKRMHKHNMLSPYVLKWFEDRFRHYLDFNRISPYKVKMNSIWINEMKEGEYNPVHIHQGTMYTGLSSVMVLKLPPDMGPEYARHDFKMNGRLQILGNVAGQFVKSDYSPNMQERDFYIFPYDMRHCVYPHRNSKAHRRTLAANADVDYNPVTSRTAA
tara:strand:+ start:894 stop:1553 length:660 start_codon:yes stop_codon:yes gene_type:complete